MSCDNCLKLERENDRLLGKVEKLEHKIDRLSARKKSRYLCYLDTGFLKGVTRHFDAGSDSEAVSIAEEARQVFNKENEDQFASSFRLWRQKLEYSADCRIR